jgi:hypothetical protein
MHELEQYLNDALREVALDIRSVDVIGLAANLHELKFANVGDIVHSALELHFKPNAIVFGYAGSVELGWFGRPAISLDLELHNAGVDVFFCLVIEAMGSSVHVRHLEVDGERCHSAQGLQRFCAAVDGAKLALPGDWLPSARAAPLPASRLN